VRQPLSLFTRETWPIALTVLIDSSDSMNLTLPVVQAAARRLLRTLGDGDRAEVAQFSRRLTVLQEPTADLAALEAAVDSVRVDGDTALYNALYVALKEIAARRREGELARRALVVFSDGNDTASMMSDDHVLEVARRAGVSVYTIGFRPAVASAVPADPLPVYFLNAVARETGGKAFFPSSLDDLDGVFDQVARELRTLYGVAYVPSNPERDGGWRRINVRTLRPNLLVRHRTGYYAPPASRLAVRR
jgi:Ca-activated chloride channel family protein